MTRSRFLNDTPEEKEKRRQQRLADRRDIPLAYQLGYYLGEKIVNDFLPCLDVDSIRLNKQIDVSPDESAEARRLHDEWSATYEREEENSNSEEWKALRAYHKMLEEKYLPPELKCHFTLLNIPTSDLLEFKKGLGASLWNCDMSHYKTEADCIKVEPDDQGFFTVITLERG